MMEKAVADGEKHFGWVTGDHFEWDEQVNNAEQRAAQAEGKEGPAPEKAR